MQKNSQITKYFLNLFSFDFHIMSAMAMTLLWKLGKHLP